MAYKNRKKNYPLYETTRFSNLREMTENVAARCPDSVAFQYKKNPKDSPRELTGTLKMDSYSENTVL